MNICRYCRHRTRLLSDRAYCGLHVRWVDLHATCPSCRIR